MANFMDINVQTTPIDFATFKSIKDSQGLFKTWTQIVNEGKQELLVSEEVIKTLIVNPTEVIGTNVELSNYENANVYYFNDDNAKDNNQLTEDKMIMYINTEYMLPLEINQLDMKSAVEWSDIISQKVNSMYQAKQDIINQEIINTINEVNIALGRVKILPDCDKPSTDWESNKNLGNIIARERNNNRKRRTKFMKGYNIKLEEMIISSDISLNMESGLTAGSASPQAYEDTLNKFTCSRMYGHNFTTANMYLGMDIGMSEFMDEKGQKQNVGLNTGNLTRPYFFKDLHGLLFYKGSIAAYGQTFPEQWTDKAGSRLQKVLTVPYRYEAAIKPVYSGINMSFFSKIPTNPSWTDRKGNVHDAVDYSKKADYDKLINRLYNSQKNLYSKFGWNGAANTNQEALTKIWKDATIEWKIKK